MSTEQRATNNDNFDLTTEEHAKLVGAYMSGAKLSTVLNVDKDTIETGYALAHAQYIAKNYTDATTLFQFLHKLDDLDPRFSLGLAGCYHEKNEYEQAIEMYKHAMIGSNLQDPTPLYYCALCYLKVEKIKEAFGLLQAIGRMEKKAEHLSIHKQAQDLLDLLTKEE